MARPAVPAKVTKPGAVTIALAFIILAMLFGAKGKIKKPKPQPVIPLCKATEPGLSFERCDLVDRYYIA